MRVLPRRLSDEVRRPRLVDRLGERWNVAAITIEAPGGYGKSVAIAQAVRDNETDPTGVDVYVRVRRSAASLAGFADGILAALGVANSEGGSVVADVAQSILDALAARSPTDITLILDDLHEITGHSDVVELLQRLVDDRPANAHYVFAGRVLPPLRLARLRAADEIVAIGATDLAMTQAELESLAEHHQSDPLPVAHGWPALARLTLAVGHEATVDFVMEEIVDSLGDDLHRALGALCVAGRADQAMLDALGVETKVALVAQLIPLVDLYEDGTVGVHDLWVEAADAVLGPRRDEVSDAVIDHLRSVGRHVAAVRVAIAQRRWTRLPAVLVAVVQSGDADLTIAEAAAWLDELRPLRLPSVDLLAAIHWRMVGRLDRALESLEGLALDVRGSGDRRIETAVASELGTLGWLLGRVDIVNAVADWADKLATGSGHRSASLMRAMMGAPAADLRGDFRLALETYERSGVRSELILRHCSTLAMLCGEDRVALSYIDELLAVDPKPIVVGQRNALLWQRGEPDAILDAGGTLDQGLDNRRNEFLALVFNGMIRAGLGRSIDVERIEAMAWARSREQAFVAFCTAANGLLDRSEELVRQNFVEHIDQIGLDDPLLRGEALRFLPYSYVLSDGLREWIDDGAGPMGLGPLHTRLLVAARAFVALRSGVVEWPTDVDGSHLLCWLPLPWSVEVAARLADADDARGAAFASVFSNAAGAPVATHLRRLADSGVPIASSGADRLLTEIPAPPTTRTSIRTNSPIVVTHGEQSSEVTSLRVCQLIGLLALHDEVARADVVSTIWADTDPSKANASFRTTLRRARDVLEPDRRPRETGFHVRQRNDRIRLERSDRLTIDVWEVRRELKEGDEAFAASDLVGAAERFRSAFAWWSPDLCAHLRDVGGESALALAALDAEVVRAMCWVAEQALANGNAEEATTVATQVLAASPYEERAHSALLGAKLALGDLDAAEQAIALIVQRAAELGVEPEAGTQMLIRRFERRRAAAPTPIHRVVGVDD